ncbi:BQ5605_C031g10903 [Microbotryum silenes-dioicae]|uniref:BQ5605_C031g10903 protein n=1 Tax=Microbotryum silenes-dioicae TaxID=796604 RepID=A0A2X0ML88_9BASI|nr:BQ5605_C031g10903 [Microbotryum silenes-dioicae]
MSNFALDPALMGPTASTSSQPLENLHHFNSLRAYPVDDEFADDSFGEDDGSIDSRDDESHNSDDSIEDDDEPEHDGEDSETDAEDEYRIEMGEVQRPPNGASQGKGKGRALNQDSLDQDDDADLEQGEGGGDEELSRLVAALRDSGASTSVGGRTALDKAFDRSIEEELDGIDDPFNNGLPNPKKRRIVPRRPDAEPSNEVKVMLGSANRYYAEGHLDQAREILTEVVRIDPAIRQSWMTLATIEEELGNYDKSITFRIVGAHLLPIKKSSLEWAALGAQSRDNGLLHQAIYCFTQAIKGDKEDVDSMWDRAVLLKMSGSTSLAITAFTALLNVIPHDPGVLRELAPLLAATEQHARATTLFLAAFDHYRKLVPHITPRNIERINTFGYQDLETIADFLSIQKLYTRCVSVIRTGVRWLQGRETETAWDALEDDREYDVMRKARIGWDYDPATRHLEDAEVYDLDVRLRLRLGVARIGEGRVEEAKRHFAIVLQENVADFPELWGAIGDAYFERDMFEDALEIFQEMAEDEITNGPAVWAKVGACHFETRDFEDALECFQAVMEEQPENLTVKMQLARTWEQLDKPGKALELIHEIVEVRRQLRDAGQLSELARVPSTRGARRGAMQARPSTTRPHVTPAERAARRQNAATVERQRHQEFILAVETLRKLDDDVEAEDVEAITEWLEVATFLVDAFRETKSLFPSDGKKRFMGAMRRQWKRKGGNEMDIEKQADEMASRLERTLVDNDDDNLAIDSFRGISFDDWLKLIIKYSFLLIKNDEAEAGLETLKHTQNAAPFKHSETRSLSIWLALASGYNYLRNYDEVVMIARRISLRRQYQSEPLRLLHALLPGGVAAVEAFNSTRLAKYLMRQLMMLERISRGAEVRVGANGAILIKSLGVDKDMDGDDEDEDGVGAGGHESLPSFVPTVPNPWYNYVYSCMLETSRSYQSALQYLLRAYERMPRQPLINLTIGIVYIHRAMTRATDNRHHQIAQGLAFLSQYRAIKGRCQEVEYNFGRVFHLLGLQSYAVRHYEACLAIAAEDRKARMQLDGDDEEDEDGEDDFARVAAYNLSNLYMLSGSPDLAKVIAHKWLSF